jgi:hypothetical protein
MTTAVIGRKFARQPAAWLMLLSWKYAAKHDQQDGDTPKMPGEPKRVQPSRDGGPEDESGRRRVVTDTLTVRRPKVLGQSEGARPRAK